MCQFKLNFTEKITQILILQPHSHPHF